MIDAFIHYMEDFIEKPHDAFGGLPVCPFARPARLRGRLSFVLTDNFFPLHIVSIAHNWDVYADHSDALILLFIGTIDWITLEQLCREVQVHPDCETLEVFAGHPASPFAVNGVYTRRDPVVNLQFNRKATLAHFRGKKS